jgi:hypothetical protein
MELARAVEQSLKTKGVHTKQLKMNGAAFSKVSEDAVLYSKMSSLSDVRSEYSKKAPAPEAMTHHHYGAALHSRMAMMKPMSLSEAHGHDSDLLSFGMAAPPPPGASAHMSFMSSDMVTFDAAPAPTSMSTSSRGDEYSVETDEINTEQAYRMVSKVLNSKKK